MKVPAASLAVDVAVDEEHVNALVENIKENGQLAPVVVRKLTHDIVDGFHRTAALQKLGAEVEIVEHEFKSDEEFLAARVVSATQHEGIKVDRAVGWINKEWDRLPIATEHKSAAAAFSAVAQGKASENVVAWAERAAKRWGVALTTLGRVWLYGDSHKSKSDNVVTSPATPTPPKDTTKQARDPSDPDSLPPKVRNLWADSKVLLAEVAKMDRDDFKGLEPQQVEIVYAVVVELSGEVSRIVATLKEYRNDS